MPLAVLLTVAGDHVPVMPLVEIEGKNGEVSPLQIAISVLKFGEILGLTVWVSVLVVAHCPASGVKV